MRHIQVSAKMRSSNPNCEETFVRSYEKNGDLQEIRVLSSEEDYASGAFRRVSTDNGRTWSEWEKQFDDNTDGRRGKIPGSEEGDELLSGSFSSCEDPNTGCKVSVGSTFYYLKGHDVGYFNMWHKGEDNFRPHAYYAIERPDGTKEHRLIELEEGGADFDPQNPRNPAFIDKNRAMASDMMILPDGDLSFVLYPSMRICCQRASQDVSAFFPSCPDMQHGLIIVRLHWNPSKNDYDFTLSNPIMLCDLQSSRGIMEPKVLLLEGGRWMVIFRGSNTMIDAWHTRTMTCTPGFKWFAVSDDEGKTFTPPMVWTFDTREAVYSPASISAYYENKKTGRLYWIGNYVSEPKTIFGNTPRWPLVICEIDRQKGCLIKETLTEIDSLREGETATELSNPNLIENRETGLLEIRLTKICMSWKDPELTASRGNWYSEAWEYLLNFEE